MLQAWEIFSDLTVIVIQGQRFQKFIKKEVQAC